jgi:predicted ATPase/DNA-binding SARP family transcriptional activator
MILGPLAIVDDQCEDGAVAGAKLRALLGVLAVRRGRVVSVDELTELLWPDDAPANPRNALQSQISQLRRSLGPIGRDLVVSRAPGYALDVPAAAVDADRFEALVDGARALGDDADPDERVRLLEDALSLWRGPALVEFADVDVASAAAARLEELRLTAEEDRFDALLARGEGTSLVPALETSVAAHPLRERLRGQLMLARFRAGRQADALETYHDARRVLDEQLGVDPGPELSRRYEALLRHEDPLARARDAEVAARAVPRSEPDAAPRPAPPPSQLPTALTSFVGRDDELRRVATLLGGARLLTLTGAGGAGKTRLAAEAATRMVDAGRWPDGTWFVELGALEDPEPLVETIARRLGLTDDGALAASSGGVRRDPLDRVIEALRERDALLVLDNCEHLVVAVAPLVRDLLSGTARLAVVATSREPLGVPGETVWSVPSLPVPPSRRDVDQDLRSWPAVRLFLDRARMADPSFAPDVDDVATVAEVCRRLDGIALAIELAAARVRTLGLDELAARLDDRFGVLTGGDRTARPRQRTLRAVVEWSWDLLEEREQAVLCRLSVFASGATVGDAEAVCAGDPVPRDEVLHVLTRLVDRSVLVADRAQRPLRFRLLETIRAYAAEQLEAAGETRDTRERHLDHVTDDVLRAVPDLRVAAQLDAMDALDADLDEVRAALGWARATDDDERGARLAVGLGWYWYLRGLRVEGLRWMRTFLDRAAPRERALATLWGAFLEVESVPQGTTRTLFGEAIDDLEDHGTPADLAFARLLAADLSAVVGDHEVVPDLLAAARAAATEAGDDGYLATADFVAGHQQLMLGDLAAAEPWLQAALDGFQRVGDRWGQVQCRMALASGAEVRGDVDGATSHVEAGLALAQQLRLRELEGILHGRAAVLAVTAGREDHALEAIDRSDRIADELGADFLRLNGHLAAGQVALRTGDLSTARRRFETAEAWLDGSPHPALHAYALTRLATVAEHEGDLTRASELGRAALDLARTTSAHRSVALALEALAGVAGAAGRAEDGALLLGAATARRATDGHLLPGGDATDLARTEATIRAGLGEDRYLAALEEGRRRDLDALPLP